MINVVLFEPEIPGNTGNIMRTCVATNARLHLIKPLGFKLDEASIKRSGVNYIDKLEYFVYENYDDFLEKNKEGDFFYFTRYGKKPHDYFNYKDYSFKILTKGKEFKFTELSDGFAAVLDIVVDLILKMQHKNQLIRVYECEGIVLVDEIETHLHLELQKVIMPLLTEIFPNIQFIVTTHSPFVLSSLSNAVAFDLEHQEIIEDLTEYSYESLAEGYFGVKTASSYMGMQLDRLEELLKKEMLSLSEKSELKDLICDFDKIPEVVSPKIIGRYLQLKNQHFAKINAL